jgi:hypothetical protein
MRRHDDMALAFTAAVLVKTILAWRAAEAP